MLHIKIVCTLGAFIFKEILYCWGGLAEVITDNGTPFVATLDWLAEKYHIHYIHISTYNLQANRVVKCSHCTIHNSLIKAYNRDIILWPTLVHYVFWADKVTIHRSTRHSLYYKAHDTEPLLPFNITEATFLFPVITSLLLIPDLIAAWTHQLVKQDDDLASMYNHIIHSQFTSISDFEHHFDHAIHDHDVHPGSLILALNQRIESVVNAKCKLYYLESMIVVLCSEKGLYHLVKVDRSVLKLRFATFHLVPYFQYTPKLIKVMQFLSLDGVVTEELED